MFRPQHSSRLHGEAGLELERGQKGESKGAQASNAATTTSAIAPPIAAPLTNHTSTAVTHSPIRSTTVAMAPTPKKDKYSVLLPTYNERRNLPIITWLLNKTFTEKYVAVAVVPISLFPLPLPHILTLFHQQP